MSNLPKNQKSTPVKKVAKKAGAPAGVPVKQSEYNSSAKAAPAPKPAARSVHGNYGSLENNSNSFENTPLIGILPPLQQKMPNFAGEMEPVFGDATSLLISQHPNALIFSPVEYGLLGPPDPLFAKEQSSSVARCCMGKGRGARWQLFSGSSASQGRAVYQMEKGASIGPYCPCINNPKFIVHALDADGLKKRVGVVVTRPRWLKAEMEIRDEEGMASTSLSLWDSQRSMMQ